MHDHSEKAGPARLRKDGEREYQLAEARTDGTVTGYASTFDREPDSYGDVIAKGAFRRTLAEWKASGFPIPLLYGHNTDDPECNIGRVVEAREDSRGLFVKAEFDADNKKSQYVRKLAAEGRLYQFSFGYAVRDQATVTLAGGTQANELRDIDLFEVSMVQIPANQHAVVTGVKRRGRGLSDVDGYRKWALIDAYSKADADAEGQELDAMKRETVTEAIERALDSMSLSELAALATVLGAATWGADETRSSALRHIEQAAAAAR